MEVIAQANDELPSRPSAQLQDLLRLGSLGWDASRSRFSAGMLNWQPRMAAKTQSQDVSFEKAMERLETIVQEMESGKLLLEDLLVRYEEGMKLVNVCQERLSRAEQKIQIITRDHSGKVGVKDFESAEAPSPQAAAIEKGHDDVSLF